MSDAPSERSTEEDPGRTAAIPAREIRDDDTDRDADRTAVLDTSDGARSGSHVVGAMPGDTTDRTSVLPVPERSTDGDERGSAVAAEPARTAVLDDATRAPVAPAERPAETPAAVDAPPPRRGNRLVATFWVLFAALLFEVGYILLIALLVALIDGPSRVGAEMPQFFRTPYLTWVPVVLFAVLYELSVLILGRAGRFAYVVASLVVGLLVWILSAQLLDFLTLHALAPGPQIASTLESPELVLVGVLAREIMLWTGYAVGARGRRLRRVNRRAREEYRARQQA